MRIRLLRQVDYWCGRPICGLLSALSWVRRLVLPKPALANPRKILFIKLFGLGSTVLALPSIRAVKERFPDAALFFLTFEQNRQILELVPMVPTGHVCTIHTDSLFHVLSSALSALAFLAKQRLDVVVDFEFFSRFTAAFGWLTWPKWQIGFYGFHAEGMKRGSFIDYQVNFNHTLHTSRAFFTLLKPLGIPQEQYRPDIPEVPSSESQRRAVHTMLREHLSPAVTESIDQWVVVNARSSSLISLRDWPVEHAAQLAGQLLESFPRLGVILIGTADQRDDAQRVVAACNDDPGGSRIANLTGKTNLRDLLEIFHLAALLVTVDSGPAHLASLTRTPTLVLFGPETPQLYEPLGEQAHSLVLGLDCQPCVSVYNGKFSHCHDNQCLKRLDPEMVFASARELLERGGAMSAGGVPNTSMEVDAC